MSPRLHWHDRLAIAAAERDAELSSLREQWGRTHHERQPTNNATSQRQHRSGGRGRHNQHRTPSPTDCPTASAAYRFDVENASKNKARPLADYRKMKDNIAKISGYVGPRLVPCATVIGGFGIIAVIWISWVSHRSSQDTSRIEQRAYASVVEGRVSGIEGRGPIKVVLTIKNKGQTPAKDLSIRTEFSTVCRVGSPSSVSKPTSGRRNRAVERRTIEARWRANNGARTKGLLATVVAVRHINSQQLARPVNRALAVEGVPSL